MLLLILTVFLADAEAGSASQSFQTEEGFTLTVERKGRAIVKADLLTGDKAEDISCSGFWNSVSYMQPFQLGQYLVTAGARAKTDTQQGDVVPFGVAPALVENWMMMPKQCAIGIASQTGVVTVTFANMGKMQGRHFTVSPETSEALGAFIKAKP